ncbi:MAG: DUF3106 domain-containing protein [Verrucomicrobiales bacterium]|nr:DUF3106 domain-containing protein [Verrucomicrobiales bacterium]
MNYWRQTRWWLVFCAAGQLLVSPLPAEDSTNAAPPAKSFSSPRHRPPQSAHGKSPVDFFRQLLAMTPEERDELLTNHPPEIRTRILVKVGEYEALNPNERELRLRATELRWYLMPLLRDSPTNRAARLAHVPDDLRELVQDRLSEWSILPTTMQQEFLENEHILHYFAHVDTSNSPSENFGREPSDAERARWNALSEPERRQVAAGFNHFFELTPDEKQKTLGTLSEAERRQMQKTLLAFDKMPPSQRAECVSAFARFASMTAPEKAEFLKNAERWSQMSPAERQAWRDLVVNVPQWPPLPIGFVVPIPGEPNPGVVTNRN